MSNQWQLCPKCQGQKTVSRPPYLPADVQQWSTSQALWTCDICNGMGLLLPPIAPPTTEEAELWKEKIQDIIRKNIKTCILDGGEMKTPEEKIGIMGEYNAATEILELLRLRSEQKSEVIELTKEKVTELVTLAYKEGFSRNGRPLGEWGDYYNENEAELKQYIDQLFKQKQ